MDADQGFAAAGRPGAAGSPLAGLVAASFAGILWGTGALVVALLIERFDVAPAAISAWRFGIGAVLLVVLFGRGLARRATRRRLALAAAAGAGMAGYVLCWFLGIERLGPAVPTLIALCLPPVLVTCVGLVRGTLRPDARVLAFVGAAVAGTGLVLAPAVTPATLGGTGAAGVLAGVGFAITSAVLYALVSLVSGRVSGELGAGPAAAAMSVAAFAATAVVLPALPGVAVPADPGAWPWLAYLGVATTTVALLAFAWGAARLTPTALTVATLLEPLTTVVLAAVLLAQPLAPAEWAGAALLLGALVGLGSTGGGDRVHDGDDTETTLGT